MANASLNPDVIVVASDEQVSTMLSGEVVVLGFRDMVYYGLEGAGTEIWDLLQTPHSVRQIIEHVVSLYDVGEHTAASDVEQLLVQLQEHGLISIEPGR
jgi:coenzyme PQQ synthesis protein D (PqqD)